MRHREKNQKNKNKTIILLIIKIMNKMCMKSYGVTIKLKPLQQ